jgi:hypothetical protein
LPTELANELEEDDSDCESNSNCDSDESFSSDDGSGDVNENDDENEQDNFLHYRGIHVMFIIYNKEYL